MFSPTLKLSFGISQSIYNYPFTDSIKKSEAVLNQSATVNRRSGWEYTSAIIIPIKIIFTMAIQIFLWIKAQLFSKKNLEFIKKDLLKLI